MILDKCDVEKVVGEIYIISNKVTNKSYVGQTRSHRLNHNKYRPFGYLGRFKDHVNEANSNKKSQCKYLNSSILKYGQDNFVCTRLITCNICDLDSYEREFIIKHNTKYPNGYNLTDGGQGKGYSKGSKIILDITKTTTCCSTPEKHGKLKSDYTKSLISERLKEAKSNSSVRTKMMMTTQNQHYDKKFIRFKHVTIDETYIDQYIRVIKNNKENTEYIRVVIDKIKTTFVGRYENINTIKQRAKLFITDLIKWQRDQIAGNPLEP